MNPDQIKAAILQFASVLSMIGTYFGRPALVAAAAALTELVNSGAWANVFAGVSDIAALVQQIIAWLKTPHPAAAAYLESGV